MKTKQLFEKIEANNFIADKTPAGLHVCITCDFVDVKLNCITTSISNKRGGCSFHTWKEFVAIIEAEYTEEVKNLITKRALRYNEDWRTFELKGEDFELQFRVWND